MIFFVRRTFMMILMVAVTGCTEYRLLQYKKVELSSKSSDLDDIGSADGKFSLEPPKLQEGRKRIVVLLDMSFSMFTSGCEGDVDNPLEPDIPLEGVKPVKATSPTPSCLPTNLSTGHDPAGIRFSLLLNWLDQVKTNTRIKYMIVPFSGGVLERAKTRNLKFVDYAQAVGIINGLKDEHELDKKVFTNPLLQPANMGTSVPLNRLTSMTDVIYTEMENQKKAGELANTIYEIFYVSDGVPTPTPAYYQTAFNLIKFPVAGRACPSTCVLDPTKCTPAAFADGGRCKVARDEMVELWGEVRDNDMGTVYMQWRYLMGLTKIFSLGRVRLHLAQLNPASIAAKLNTASTNFMQALRAGVADAKWSDVTTATPPYSLVDSTSQLDRYVIRSLFVANPNVRINSGGTLGIDSDGDGLFDDEEKRHDTDPFKARNDSLCLDSIKIQAAYRVRCAALAESLNCDALSDTDGDGLNDCEEKILSTNLRKVDSDGDGIPDGLEIVYGFNPLESDVDLDSNGDGMLNFQQFSKGASPYNSLDTIRPTLLVNLERTFLGYETSPSGGAPRATYSIVLKSFPYAAVAKKTAPVEMYYADGHTADIAVPETMQVISAPITAETNRILVVMAVSTVEKPDNMIWMLKKVTTSAADGKTPVNLDLSSLQVMSVFE